MMGGREKRRGHRRNSRHGGPPWPATRTSPAGAVRALWATVWITDNTGRERRARRPRLGL
jgi:hypothetical protein